MITRQLPPRTMQNIPTWSANRFSARGHGYLESRALQRLRENGRNARLLQALQHGRELSLHPIDVKIDIQNTMLLHALCYVSVYNFQMVI
jgi:hypothetical protein